jgi:hypothetical protein
MSGCFAIACITATAICFGMIGFSYDAVMLVWARLRHIAQASASNIYQLKQGLLDDYICSQLRSPTLRMALA